MGSKKMQVWLPVIFSVVMVIGMIIGYQLKDKTSGTKFLSLTRRSTLQELVELVKGKYVDKVSMDTINDKVANELLGNLDPHSVYIPADDVKEVNEELMGNFQGIGIEFQLFNDTLHVIHVIKGGPSEKAGIQTGDKIIKVNDTTTIAGKKLNPDDIRKLLRGPADSRVSVVLLRNNNSRKVVIQRGVIPVSSLDAAYMLTPKIGFIRVNKFAERTYEEFMQGMEKLKKQGMEELILDLRGNGGGLMKEATDIADEFLSGDKLIVYTEGEHVPRFDYQCRREGIFEKGKLEVLIDESSASASEVLAGALQDWDRATIIGRRSFGKGLVQQQFQLSDGSAVRLTIARYFTPLGRNIQKSYSKGKAEYQEDLSNRYHNGELVKADTSQHSGKPYKTPAGRLVYGGGGITPDIFVSFDTTRMESAMLQLYRKNTLGNYVYNLYVQNPAYFKGFRSPKELSEAFHPGEKEWQGLVNFANKDSISLKGMKDTDRAEVLERVRSLMARQIWRNEGYFELANQKDATVTKALSELQ